MSDQKEFLVELTELVARHRQRKQPQTARVQQHNRIGRLFRWFLPNGGTLILIALLIMTQQVWAMPGAINAPGPSATTINYQGKLSTPAGAPLNGTYGLSFALYNAATNGALIWGPESHLAVQVSNGLFSVGLGSQTAGGIPTTVWNGDRYLQITINGEALSPRELIRGVPVAGMALTVPDRALSPSHFTAFADDIYDKQILATTSYEFVDFGTTSLNFNLPYRAKVYIYLRGSIRNTSGGSTFLTLNIDGKDHSYRETNIPLYLETRSLDFETTGVGAVLTLEPGNHTIRPRFARLSGTETAGAATVGYGYIVLGQVP